MDNPKSNNYIELFKNSLTLINTITASPKQVLSLKGLMIFLFCSYTKSLGISPVLLLYKAYIGELDT